MSTCCRVEVGQPHGPYALLRAADIARDDDRGVRGAVLQQQLTGLADLPGTAARARVVQGEHQVGRGRRAQPPAMTSHGLSRSESEMTA